MNRSPSRRQDQSGAALVEFALVLIPLLLITVGAISFGLTLGLQQSITHAASSAAREAAIATDADVDQAARDVVAAQLSWLGGVAPSGGDITVTEGERVTVSIDTANPFHAIGIFNVRPPQRLSSSATLLKENVG